MSFYLEIQNAMDYAAIPTSAALEHWCDAALQQAEGGCVLRVVDEAEGRELNQTYRGRDYATNILSFPNTLDELEGLDEELAAELAAEDPYLGDLVLCAPVVEREAQEQHKTIAQHWAHLLVHGVLHLQGFDHIEDAEADAMEALEVSILARLGFPNPYQPTD